MTPAPILLFAFNRPRHLQRTLVALAANELAAQSDLIIYCDGFKPGKKLEDIEAARTVARATTGFASVRVMERDKNWGLAPNIIDGVSSVVAEYGRVIVLEDDLVTSPYFLRYMNDGLEIYADNPRVASIHGYCFPHAVPNPPETFFLKGADCLGWSTWARAWNFFDADAGRLLHDLQANDLACEFNVDNTYDYIEMLKQVRDGKVSSWAVRWRASAFLNNMYTLHPGVSLVQHTGCDSSGTHCGTTDVLDVELSEHPVSITEMPVQENTVMREAIKAFHQNITSSGVLHRIKQTLKTLLPPVVLQHLKRAKAKASSLVQHLRSFINRNQFTPSFAGVFVNPFWLCRRELYQVLREVAPGLEGAVLDFGCGTGPYKELLVNMRSYTGLEYDTPENRAGKSADIFYDGVTIPCEGASFDGLLATQSLEHIPNPERIAAEWARVLRPGGKILLTVPFMWPEHEMPYDFRRYTSSGLKNLLEEHGFKVLEHRRLLSDCRAPAQIFLAWLYDSVRFGQRSSVVRYLLTALLFAPTALFATALAALFPKTSNTYLDNLILAERI